MASDVSKTVAFLSSYSSELVQLDKHTLEALLKSNRASHVKEWKAAQNFWYRKLSTLLPEHREELDDWEFILCNMSKLQPAAFLPRLRRCFNRVDSFIAERAEAIHKLACQNLETALQRKHMLQFPMSTFTRIFLERYKDKLETEQMEALSMWTENLCVMRASDREAVTARRAARLISVQEFFAHFAAEIVGLQKQTLRDVVMSNEANKYPQWKQAQHFFVRDYVFLNVEEKDLLEDWELVLCDKSALESVALLPGLQRCFQRVDSFMSERAADIKKLACQNLETALQRKHMLQFPMSTFTRIFLERYKDKLETEQMEGLSMWRENLCVMSASDRDAVTAGRAARLISVQEFFAHFAAEIVGLQKQTLRDVVVSNEANKHPQWMNAKTFFRRDYVFLNVEEKDLLEDWELVLCDKSALESVALLPRLQRSVAFLPRLLRCFKRMDSFITERAETIKKTRLQSFRNCFRKQAHVTVSNVYVESTFTRIFLERYKDKLETEQLEALSMWSENLCARSTVEREAVTARRAAALISVQEFFCEFAAEIVELQKLTLRDVVMRNEAHKNKQWSHAQNFWCRDYVFLTLEDKELLEDWEFCLCNMSTLEPVAFLPRLTRSFGKGEGNCRRTEGKFETTKKSLFS